MLPQRKQSLTIQRPIIHSRRSIAEERQGINRGYIAETGMIPAGLQLIRDTNEFKVINTENIMVEDAFGKEQPALKVTGLFQEGDKDNANGRIYSTRDVLAPAVRSIQDDISSRAVMGEYDHPSDAKIHLDRVSHLISKLWMEGRKVYGEAEVLHKLPCGAMMRGLFEHKVRVGISSRGVGDMEVVEGGGQDRYRVLPGYSFVTFDCVAEPSVSNAILNIQEGLTKRIRPLHQQKNKFNPTVYQNMLVKEINSFFGLK